ncbi:hypothetical protein FQN54_003946 [Arachnomyces sp. PD_36]|nr:hypothetical protein FQN54_003946 [Arachnomyces sp. PD_36]
MAHLLEWEGATDYVRELVYQIDPPNQADLLECETIRSIRHEISSVADLRVAIQSSLFCSNSEQSFGSLRKLTVRFPAHYSHSKPLPKSAHLYGLRFNDDFISLFQQYRYATCMYFRMYMELLSRWRRLDPLTLELLSIQSVFRKNPKALMLDIIDLSPYHWSALDRDERLIIPVKSLRVKLSPGQIYWSENRVQTPNQIALHWGEFRSRLGCVLKRSFPDVETMHLCGWWKQDKYLYLRYTADMALDISSFQPYGGRTPSFTDLTLEDISIHPSSVGSFRRLLVSMGLRMLKLKNCILVTDIPGSRPWKNLFERASQQEKSDGQSANGARSVFNLRIESADGVEGCPSAFRCAWPGPGEGVARSPHGWGKGEVQCEEGAVEAYLEFQSVLAGRGVYD